PGGAGAERATAEAQVAQNPATPGSPSGVDTANLTPTGKEGTLAGTWTAQPSPDTTITVTFKDPGQFVWKVTQQGKDRQFEGNSNYANGILTLVRDENNTMVGDINWQDDAHFQFRILGGGPSDPGLTFTKSS